MKKKLLPLLVAMLLLCDVALAYTDITQNGIIDIRDAVLTLGEYPDFLADYADVNGDGIVNEMDAARIADFLTGKYVPEALSAACAADKTEIAFGESLCVSVATQGGFGKCEYRTVFVDESGAEIPLSDWTTEAVQTLSVEAEGIYTLRVTARDAAGETVSCTGGTVAVYPVKTAQNGDFTYAVFSGGARIVKWLKPDSTSATIPATLEGAPVTEIGEGAFQGMELLASVSLPNSIAVIGKCAFKGCGMLTTMN